MAEQVQSGPQQSRARRFLGAGKRTLDGEDRSERIKTGRKGTLFRAFSPTIKPEFPQIKMFSREAIENNPYFCSLPICNKAKLGRWVVALSSPRAKKVRTMVILVTVNIYGARVTLTKRICFTSLRYCSGFKGVTTCESSGRNVNGFGDTSTISILFTIEPDSLRFIGR